MARTLVSLRVKPPYGGGSGVLVYILGSRDHGPRTVGPDPGLWAWDHWPGPWALGTMGLGLGPGPGAPGTMGPRTPWAPGLHGPRTMGPVGPGTWWVGAQARAWAQDRVPRPGTWSAPGPRLGPGRPKKHDSTMKIKHFLQKRCFF